MFHNFDSALLESLEFKEDSVREVIILPMLQRLGYTPSGQDKIIRSKALTHPYVNVGTGKRPVTIIPDYLLLHDNQPVLVLDAKRPTENILSGSNVEQAYSYCIHPEIRCKHFALCNGRTLVVFHVEEPKPLLHLEFSDFDTRWDDIEKFLGSKFLTKPFLRDFAPDLGMEFFKRGCTPESILIISGARINMIARLDEDHYSAISNHEFGEQTFCVSYDFDRQDLPAIVGGIPEPLQKLFMEALARAPFHACADFLIEVDISIRLGEQVLGLDGPFRPLIITKVNASRFNLDPILGDPDDVPDHVFRLKNAFRIATKSDAV